MIYLKSSTTRYTTYKARNTPEIIIGRSCTLKTYSDKSIGTINLELLYAIVYHEDIATSRAHITPRQIVSFVLFFIMVSFLKVIYLSLNKTNISLRKLAVNRNLRRVIENHNAMGEVRVAKEKREVVILPQFSCHHLMHTFCARLCEADVNIKVIQSVMGHKDIQTTRDIYAGVTGDKKKKFLEQVFIHEKFY